MTLAQLNNILTSELKRFIKERNHIVTGKLYNSIRFNSVDGPGGVVDIKFDSEHYIVYLDNGLFVDEFFERETTTDAIAQYEATKIQNSIDSLIGGIFT